MYILFFALLHDRYNGEFVLLTDKARIFFNMLHWGEKMQSWNALLEKIKSSTQNNNLLFKGFCFKTNLSAHIHGFDSLY